MAVKVINKLIEAIWLMVVFFLPLYFAVFLPTNNVFELNKLILFKILVLLLLFLTLIKFYNSLVPSSTLSQSAGHEKPFALRLQVAPGASNVKILTIPLIFISVLIAVSLFSINRGISLYGSYNRQLGLISCIYFFLFFILLLININTKEQIARIIKTGVLASLIVSIYGLVQAAGYDPLLWSESTELRATSTFGQPNLLAMYLLLVMPLGLYLFFGAKKLFLKLGYLFIFFTNLTCLFFTYSLSGWVGLLGGIFITGAIYFLSLPPLERGVGGVRNIIKGINPLYPPFEGGQTPLSLLQKRGAGGLIFNKRNFIITVSALIVCIALVAMVIKIQNKWVFQARVSSLINLQSGSLASRYNFWKASWQAILKKPLLGYGPETQSEVLIGYYQKDWGVYENVNVRPDRAHNLFLDILLTTGIVGLVAYMALLYLFFKLLFGIIKNKPEFKGLAYCFLFALVNYLLALQLNFTFVVSEVYFWLYLALVYIIHFKLNNDAEI